MSTPVWRRVIRNADSLGALIANVANANQTLEDLGAEIQTEQEGVNKALVDVETARDNATAAEHDFEVSQQSVKDANTAIAAAQQRFNTFAAATYMNGPSSSYLTATSPEDIIATASAVRPWRPVPRRCMDNLQRARTEQVNKESAARLAKQKAEKAAADAKASQDAAVAALTTSKQKFADQREQITRWPPSATRPRPNSSRPQLRRPLATGRRGHCAAAAAGGPAANRDRAPGAPRLRGPELGRLGSHAADGAECQRHRRPDRDDQPGAGHLGHLGAGHRSSMGKSFLQQAGHSQADATPGSPTARFRGSMDGRPPNT